ncbi:MAG TPA: ParA family protein [Dehalococcoidia bacterium]|nr:ParA family protein [Dehalococcoidia bacterium]
MTQIVAICNQKGGVGKTTLTINLGAALAQDGSRVLLIDADPQGHLSEGVGLQDLYLQESPTLYEALVGAKGVGLTELIQRPPAESFDVIPSNYQMMLAEQALFMARNREHKLTALLAQLKTEYDWILIDCPPALGNLTDNALNAARQVVIPIQAEATSVRALELLFDQIESVERGLNIEIRVLAVVPNLVQDSTMAKRILVDLRESIPTVAPFELRKRVLLQMAWSKGCSIFAFRGLSSGEERNRREIAQHYEELAALLRERAGPPATTPRAGSGDPSRRGSIHA